VCLYVCESERGIVCVFACMCEREKEMECTCVCV